MSDNDNESYDGILFLM